MTSHPTASRLPAWSAAVSGITLLGLGLMVHQRVTTEPSRPEFHYVSQAFRLELLAEYLGAAIIAAVGSALSSGLVLSRFFSGRSLLFRGFLGLLLALALILPNAWWMSFVSIPLGPQTAGPDGMSLGHVWHPVPTAAAYGPSVFAAMAASFALYQSCRRNRDRRPA